MVVTSKKYTLNKEDLKSLLVGLLITSGGAAITFLAENLGNFDFGQYAPILVPLFSLAINAVRKWLTTRKYVV